MLQNLTALKTAMKRIKISNGCEDNMFNFVNPVQKRINDSAIFASNTNAPSDERCNIYSPQGGALTPYIAPPTAMDNTQPAGTATDEKPGHPVLIVYQVTQIGTTAASGTASANDLALQINGIKKEVCHAINQAMGITYSGDTPPAASFSGTSGSYVNGSLSSNRVLNNSYFNGRALFCYEATPYNMYVVASILLER